MRTAGLLTLIGIVLVAAGCQRATQVTVHPVRGQVNYGGKPAAGVKVYFFPTSAAQVPEIPMNPHGVTGADGKFTLTTFTEGDGASEGGYLIVLNWPPATKSNEEATTDQLHGWYDPAHSKLTAHVKTGDNLIPPIELPVRSTPPQASQGVPGRN